MAGDSAEVYAYAQWFCGRSEEQLPLLRPLYEALVVFLAVMSSETVPVVLYMGRRVSLLLAGDHCWKVRLAGCESSIQHSVLLGL